MRERREEIKSTGRAPLPFQPPTKNDGPLQRIRELRGPWVPLGRILDAETKPRALALQAERAALSERESTGPLMTQGSAGFFKSGEGEGEGEGAPFVCEGPGLPIEFFDLTALFPRCAATIGDGHVVIDEISETICIHVTHTVPDATEFAFIDGDGEDLFTYALSGSTFDIQWTFAEFVTIDDNMEAIVIKSLTEPDGHAAGILDMPWFAGPVACSASLSATGVTETATVDFVIDMDTLELTMDVTHDLGGDAVLEFVSVTGEVTQSFPVVPTGFDHDFTPWEMAALWQPGAFDVIRISGGTAQVTLSGVASCVENLGDIYYCPITLDGDGAGTASTYTGSGYIVISLLSGYRGILLEHDLSNATEVQFIATVDQTELSWFELPLSGSTLEYTFDDCEWDMYADGGVHTLRIATTTNPQGEIGGGVMCDNGEVAGYFIPDATVDYEFEIENPGSENVKSFGIGIELPVLWDYVGVTASTMPADYGVINDGRYVKLLWITPPTFPLDITLSLDAPNILPLAPSMLKVEIIDYLDEGGAASMNIPQPMRIHLGDFAGVRTDTSIQSQRNGILNGSIADCPIHSADQDENYVISLSELLRVIQFFNSGGYHCEEPGPPTEDGYRHGVGTSTSCTPHDSDFSPQNWAISLEELQRLIQYFNTGGYQMAEAKESPDGFEPGFPTTSQSASISFELLGDRVILHECGTAFGDPSFVALDGCDIDISSSVEVIGLGAVDVHTAGAYTLSYTLDHAGHAPITLERLVIVQCEDDVQGDFAEPFIVGHIREILEIASPNPIYPEDLLSIDRLNLSFGGMTDLSGMEYLQGLTELDLHGNCIEDIAPLRFLGNVTSLNLHDNRIEDISALAHLESLDTLWLSRNHIVDISPLVENTNFSGVPDGEDFSFWARVNLNYNPLDQASFDMRETLEARGVWAWWPEAATSFEKSVTPDEWTALLELKYDEGTVTLESYKLLPVCIAAPVSAPGEHGHVVIKDSNDLEIVAPVQFGLHSECNDTAEGEHYDDVSEAFFDEATTVIAVPVTGDLDSVDYFAPDGTTTKSLTLGGPKAMTPCEDRADQPGDPIPISMKLIHGNPDYPDDRSYVIVIVGEAFTRDHLGSPDEGLGVWGGHGIAYSRAVADMMQFTMDHEPFKEYADFIKVYRLDFISKDPALRIEGHLTLGANETAFGMLRGSGGGPIVTEALRNKIKRTISNAGLQQNNYVLFINGFGSMAAIRGEMMRVTNHNDNRREVALHEFGHSIGYLADEYEFDHGLKRCCEKLAGVRSGSAVEEVNVIGLDNPSRVPTFADIPWRHWLVDPSIADPPCNPGSLGDSLGTCPDTFSVNCDCDEPASGCPNPLPLCEPGGNYILEVCKLSGVITDECYASSCEEFDCEPQANEFIGRIKGRSTWPEPLDTEALIGLYEGGRYRWRGVYRPQLRCRMRSGDDTEGSDNTMQFCIVCREHLTAQLLHRSKLAGLRVPEASELTYTDQGGAIVFSLSLRDFPDSSHPVEIVWKVNDVEQTGSADSPTFTLNVPAEEIDDFIVTATIHDQTPWIHPESVGRLRPLIPVKILNEIPIQLESWTLRREGI